MFSLIIPFMVGSLIAIISPLRFGLLILDNFILVDSLKQEMLIYCLVALLFLVLILCYNRFFFFILRYVNINILRFFLFLPLLLLSIYLYIFLFLLGYSLVDIEFIRYFSTGDKGPNNSNYYDLPYSREIPSFTYNTTDILSWVFVDPFYNDLNILIGQYKHILLPLSVEIYNIRQGHYNIYLFRKDSSLFEVGIDLFITIYIVIVTNPFFKNLYPYVTNFGIVFGLWDGTEYTLAEYTTIRLSIADFYKLKDYWIKSYNDRLYDISYNASGKLYCIKIIVYYNVNTRYTVPTK